MDFSVSPSPLGPNWVFELGFDLVAVGPRGLGDEVLGTGLDNINPNSSVFVLLDPVHFCLKGEKC